MRRYVPIVLVMVAVVAFVVWLKVGKSPPQSKSVAASPPTHTASDEEAGCGCGPLETNDHAAQLLDIPTGSGLPCLVAFGSDKSDECQKMDELLLELAPRLEGNIDLVKVSADPNAHITKLWRLRVIPTLIIVNPQGEELDRHERYLPAADLLEWLESNGIKLDK